MNNNLPVIIADIRSDIRSIEEDKALLDDVNFDARTDAIDFIDFHVIDRIEALPENEELNILQQQAEIIKDVLERINNELFTQLRKNINASSDDPLSFREMIEKYLTGYFDNVSQQDKIGYDNLDIFINGLLSDRDIPEPTMGRGQEMVFYQKTPARLMFELVELIQINQDDIFFDVGSGLGQVAILIHLLTGVTAKGIEYEPAYCDYANTCAAHLNLSQVEFINNDARKANYSQGTVFFLYTPFEGAILQSVIELLQQEARERTISIFTYGPCSPTVAKQTWLKCINGDADDIYKLYAFRSLIS